MEIKEIQPKGKNSKKKDKIYSDIVDITLKYMFLLSILVITAIVVFFIFFRPTKQISVPNVVGKSFLEAVSLMQEKNLYVKVKKQHSKDPSDYGKVLDQHPKEGSIVRAKRLVALSVSQGTVVSEVPDVVGKSLGWAEDIIQGEFSGYDTLLEIYEIKKIFTQDENGIIVAQSPKAGSKINNIGTKMSIIISRGNKKSDEVVDVTGLHFSEVYQYLENKKVSFEFFLINNREQILVEEKHSYYLDSGMILSQSPISGKIADTTMMQLGVRAGLYTQKNNALNKEKETASFKANIKIAEIPMNKHIGTITVYKIRNNKERKLFAIDSYDKKIAFPYQNIVGVSYKAVDENNNDIWLYTITKK